MQRYHLEENFDLHIPPILFIVLSSFTDAPRMLVGTKKNVPTSMRPRWKQDGNSMKWELDEHDEMGLDEHDEMGLDEHDEMGLDEHDEKVSGVLKKQSTIPNYFYFYSEKQPPFLSPHVDRNN